MINRQIGPMARKLNRYIKQNMNQMISDLTDNQVTSVQARILFYLEWMNDHEKIDVYQKDIEAFLSVSKSTASEMISTLEHNGFISRIKLENDGRLRKIVLNEKGYETNKKIGETFKNFELSMQNKLSEKELESFFAIIDKLIN
jgi:DNA-binding MarR family transcriptional regulator